MTVLVWCRCCRRYISSEPRHHCTMSLEERNRRQAERIAVPHRLGKA